MATKTYLVKKWTLGRKVLPCEKPGCDIRTNKQYRGPNGGKPMVACMLSHAEAAYLLGLARQQKPVVLAVA